MRRNGSKASQGESIRLSASILLGTRWSNLAKRVGGAAWREAGTEHEWPACDRDQATFFLTAWYRAEIIFHDSTIGRLVSSGWAAFSGMITVETIDEQKIPPRSRRICRFAARKRPSIPRPSGRAEYTPIVASNNKISGGSHELHRQACRRLLL
jgi:hypothetical protein